MKRSARSTTRTTALAIAGLVGGSLLLAACGQKGPLYLPDAGKQPVPQATAPAPAAGSSTEAKKTDKPAAR